MGPSAEQVAEVIASHAFAKPREIEDAQAWGERYHPDKDLAELLFMRGVFDRSKVGLIRRMAKMARPSSTRTQKPPAAPEPDDQGSEDVGGETQPVPTDSERVRVRVRNLHKQPPERVGKYEILEKVAQGGMGVIFKARHVDLDRIFAVKVLTPRAEASQEAVARFQREAKTAARLDHPNIVRVHDVGVQDQLPYLVMDFVDGSNLGDVIKEEGLGLRKAAQIARSIALALHHAHETGVVHRDVKPDNIILDAAGEPKITDFGIVKDLSGEAEDSRLTQTGFTLGSPCYMSPEQAAGRHDDVGPRSDVYSLAATLYEMLTEKPPHDGDSIHEIMTKVVRDDVLPVRHHNQQVPRDLEVVCMKALESEQERRYATAKEFAADLGRFLDEEPVLAKPAGLGTKLRRVAKRHRAASAATLFVALLTVAGLGVAWNWQRQLHEQVQAQREARVNEAEARLEAGVKAKNTLERRRAYYDAIKLLDVVLAEEPGHPRAGPAKRRAVLSLSDHLIETGEASFAEFVLMQGAGVADEAEITSRIEAARLGIWAERAEEAELAGDLGLALEHYTKGLRSLQEAGYGGERLRARIDDLQDVLRERQAQREAEELARLAEASAADGDHVAAYRTYQRALALVPDDREVAGRLEHHRREAAEECLRLADRGRNLRDQVVAAKDELSGTATGLEQLDARLQASAGSLQRGETARGAEDYATALTELAAAIAELELSYAHAGAIRAQDRARVEAAGASKRNAARFAPGELGLARDQQFRGDQALARGAYGEAAELYDRAASTFRKAARTGTSKSLVADARERAQAVRAKLTGTLNREQETPQFKSADADFRRAERHYDQREYEPAKDLYDRASAAFEQVLKQAPQIIEAYGARTRALSMRENAKAELAREFASDDFSRARQAELTGEQALTDNDPAAASKAFGEAIYRYGRAIQKARPHAASKREYDALLLLVEEARQLCVDDELEWKSNFKRAEERLRQAEDALERRYWNGATRHLERALKLYRSLHR
jgi:hypothetical protein